LTITELEFIRLGERYKEIKDLPKKGFFLGIADYIEFISDSPGLDAIVSGIKEIEKKTLIYFEKSLVKDLQLAESNLYKIIQENKFDFPELKKTIDDYEEIKSERIQSSASKKEALHGGLAGIIRAIKGYKNQINAFIVIDQEGQNIAGYSISSFYQLYEEELRKFREKRKTSIWGSWDSLVIVYLLIKKYEEELNRIDPVKDFWKRLNFVGLHGEIQEILDNNKGNRLKSVQDK